jgi:hypothetical protein
MTGMPCTKARELALSVVGRAWPREVRLARIRDIVCLNGQPGPIRGVLDVAISRVTMNAMHQQVAVRPMQSRSTDGRDIACR